MEPIDFDESELETETRIEPGDQIVIAECSASELERSIKATQRRIKNYHLNGVGADRPHYTQEDMDELRSNIELFYKENEDG